VPSDRPRRCAEQQRSPVVADIADTTTPRSDQRNTPTTKEDTREKQRQRRESGEGTQKWNDARVMLSVDGTDSEVPGRRGNEVVYRVLAAGVRVGNCEADAQSENRDYCYGALHGTPRLIVLRQPKVSSAVPADASGPKP
jgi:hypothetical protein